MDHADSELLAKCADGDHRAFEELYDRHVRLVFGVSWVMSGSREVAEDIAQDAFLALWRNATSFDPTRASVRTWLLAVTRHIAIDRRRRAVAEGRANFRWSGRQPASEADPVAELVMAGSDVADLRRALADLSAVQRDVVERSFLDERSHQRIARELAIPVGTVKSRSRLGLERLRRAMTA